MKKFFIALIGGTVLLLGVVLLFLPGPGVLVIGAGVAILATEFIWARRVWRRAKGTMAKARRKFGLRDWLRRARAGRNNGRVQAEPGRSDPAVCAVRESRQDVRE